MFEIYTHGNLKAPGATLNKIVILVLIRKF